MNAFRWTRSREMRAANERPRADQAPMMADAYALRRPDPRDGRGNVTPLMVAVWLTENGWTLGETGDPQGPLAVAKRLLFARQCFEQVYRERGGAQ